MQLLNLVENKNTTATLAAKSKNASIVDKMQFGPPKGFLDVSADMRAEDKKNGGIIKTVIIIAKMPTSHPDFDAEPTIITAGGLTITTYLSFSKNMVT